MKTVTKRISLSLGLDATKLSPESLSTLFDTWLELQTSATEAVQAPTPNLFSFAETCLFFAVILQNEPDGGKNKGSLPIVDDEELTRVIAMSLHDTHAQPHGDTSSKSADATKQAWGFDPSTFEEIKAEPESDLELREDWVDRNLYNADDDVTDTLDQPSRLPGLNLWDDTSVADFPRHSPPRERVYTNALEDMRGNSTNSSFARQFEPPTPQAVIVSSSSPSYHPQTARYRAPYEHIDGGAGGENAIGIVYLTSTPHENVPSGEANIGIILAPAARGKGLAREAVDLVLLWAFEEIGLHRVQAGVIDNDIKGQAITMFTQM
jgi:RimJ/RimL family protein N-acetyltransferase